MSTRNRILFFAALCSAVLISCTTESNKWKELNDQFMANNKSQNNVVTLKDGLQYKVLTKGLGLKPNANSYVSISYTGRLIDGTVFDSTRNDTTYVDTPTAYLSIASYVSGFQEALLKMTTGSRWEVYIPQSLGYGSDAMGIIPAYSTLIFDVQLIGVQ
jgi:FKBP-type peptidyl-prolyl cis-trans isomerase FklB